MLVVVSHSRSRSPGGDGGLLFGRAHGLRQRGALGGSPGLGSEPRLLGFSLAPKSEALGILAMSEAAETGAMPAGAEGTGLLEPHFVAFERPQRCRQRLHPSGPMGGGDVHR